MASKTQRFWELVGFSTIKEMELRFLTTAQREAKYGAAR